MKKNSKEDNEMMLAELRERATEWATEHGVAVNDQYIQDQVDEAIERTQYGDAIGGAVCMMRASATMIAADYTIEQLTKSFDNFNSKSKLSLLISKPYELLVSMGTLFDLSNEVKQQMHPHSPQEFMEKETQILRVQLFRDAKFAKQVSELSDQILHSVGQLISTHDCEHCDKDKTQCAVYTSGAYRAVQEANERFKVILRKDIADLEALLSRNKQADIPIEKIAEQFPDDDDLDARFALNASTALMIMGAYEMSLGDCAIVSDVMERYKKYEDIAYGFFKEECEKRGFTMEMLHDIAQKERKNMTGDLLDELKKRLGDMFDPSKKDKDDPKKPGNIKFGKN